VSADVGTPGSVVSARCPRLEKNQVVNSESTKQNLSGVYRHVVREYMPNMLIELLVPQKSVSFQVKLTHRAQAIYILGPFLMQVLVILDRMSQ
jgi:hypothetical protein